MSAAKLLLASVLLCCFLTGCSLLSAVDPEQAAVGNNFPAGFQPTFSWTEETEEPQPAGSSAVKTVLLRQGVCDTSNPPIAYSYELPMIDLGGAYAAACNREIEARFGEPIRESLDDMEQMRAPVVQTVGFQSYVYGSVLTLRVNRTDVDGSRADGIYTVNAESGEQATTEELCRAAGIPAEELSQRLSLAVEERLRVIARGDSAADDAAFTAALNQSLAQLSDLGQLKLYIDSDGSLICVTDICAPSGSFSREELRVR